MYLAILAYSVYGGGPLSIYDGFLTVARLSAPSKDSELGPTPPDASL